MAPRQTKSELARLADEIAALVREGFPPPGRRVGQGEVNAVTEWSRRNGAKQGTTQSALRRARAAGLAHVWENAAPPAEGRVVLSRAAAGAGRRVYLLTAAQDETAVHEPFWANLMAYAEWLGAQVFVGGFTYQKGLFEDHSVETGRFRTAVEPFLQPAVVDLAPGLVWYGRANILPTAVDPLSGWDTQTRAAWMIAPHAKIALKSVPVMPGQRPKQIMTTGVCTVANYVQRNAGQKAEFHHTIGCTIVEVAEDGAFWCRQISATPDGAFQDLDRVVAKGVVTTLNRVEAITFGDLHTEVIDAAMARHALGCAPDDPEVVPANMLDRLQPRAWFIHDSFDFTARSHHTRNDPHQRVMRVAEGQDDVRAALSLTARYLMRLRRGFGELVHVASNHNMHLDLWLKDHRAFGDPINARLWCELNAAWMAALEAGAGARWLIHEHALKSLEPSLAEARFLGEGESYQVCQGVAPVECGLHSHVGPRGSRGSLANLSRIVERVNIAHGHGPGIREAAYMAGTLGRRDMAWSNKGPGDWQAAHIVTYPNGKRTLVTQWADGRWRDQ